ATHHHIYRNVHRGFFHAQKLKAPRLLHRGQLSRPCAPCLGQCFVCGQVSATLGHVNPNDLVGVGGHAGDGDHLLESAGGGSPAGGSEGDGLAVQLGGSHVPSGQRDVLRQGFAVHCAGGGDCADIGGGGRPGAGT